MKTLARAADKAEIVRRLTAIQADSAARWGRMSAHQMICHLSDSFLMALRRRPTSSAGTFLQRTVVKWIALYAPLRWPPGIPTRPEVDQEKGGTRPVEFAADVARVRELLDVFTAAGPDFDWPPHPVLGRLSRRGWLRWGYLHTDHHLRQFGA